MFLYLAVILYKIRSIGINSLLCTMTEIHARLTKRTGISIRISVVFRNTYSMFNLNSLTYIFDKERYNA